MEGRGGGWRGRGGGWRGREEVGEGKRGGVYLRVIVCCHVHGVNICVYVHVCLPYTASLYVTSALGRGLEVTLCLAACPPEGAGSTVWVRTTFSTASVQPRASWSTH